MLLFVFLRREVVERRVKALRVVNGIDESADAPAGIVCIPIGETLHLFLLQSLHEALRFRVVIRISDTAHARLDAVKMQKFGVGSARVLNAAIGMMEIGWSYRR